MLSFKVTICDLKCGPILRPPLGESNMNEQISFGIVFDAIRELMSPPEPEPKRREIGFP
jgi:hypothetical protein